MKIVHPLKFLSNKIADFSNFRTLFLKNRVARNSILNIMGFAVPTLMTLIFTPSLVHRMGTEDYGIWNVAISALGLMGVFEFGLGTALAKYVAEYTANNNSYGLSAAVSMGFVFNVFIGILMMLPLYFFSPQIARLFPDVTASSSIQLSDAIRWSSFGFIPLLLKNSGLAIPSGLQRYEIPVMVKVLQNTFTLLSAFMIVFLGGGVVEVVLSTVVLMWLSGFLSLLIALRMLKGFNTRIVFSREYAKKIFSFMIFTGTTGIGIAMFSSLDRITVGAILGLSAVTYYTVSIGIANKLTALSSAFTQALMPAASSWQATGNNQKLKNYLWRSTVLTGLLNIVLGGGLILIAEPFMRIWMGNEFAEHVIVPFRILILVYALMSVSAPSFHIANGMGFPWINAVGTILQGVGIVGLIVLLGPRYGLTGAAWANASSWIKFISLVYIAIVLNRSGKKIEVGDALRI